MWASSSDTALNYPQESMLQCLAAHEFNLQVYLIAVDEEGLRECCLEPMHGQERRLRSVASKSEFSQLPVH